MPGDDPVATIWGDKDEQFGSRLELFKLVPPLAFVDSLLPRFESCFRCPILQRAKVLAVFILKKIVELCFISLGYKLIDFNAGRDEYGDKIGRGVYLYRLTVRSPDGKQATKLQRLVLIR